ncbi:MAG TPA: LuxR C-terminal-related transcriptional regulator [Verrucomicrobiae bacterium]|nr:LuxR C-terminal-related transcriptional regulator [Verrucomicrobiae bacterium]
MAIERADADRGLERLRADMSSVRLAIGLVDLADMTVRAISDAGSEALGLPVERILGRPVSEVIDPRDRRGAAMALEALRSGAVEFYRAHRHAIGQAAPQTGLCAWVRRLDLDGRPFAFVRYVDPRVPPGPWPTGADVFEKAVAIVVTDSRGVARSVASCPVLGEDYSVDDLVGAELVPSPNIDNLVTLAGWRAARIEGVSVAYAAPVRDRSGAIVELEAIATAITTARAGASGWLVVLVHMDPPASAREAELERHLWRIAAELEASGILMHAGTTPGLSLARIPEAAGLTPRQWEVLRRIVAGERVPTIASELYVSQSTVRNHLSAIFERFGVHSQAALIARLTPRDAPSTRTDALPMA